MAGVPLKAVQEMLGHSTILMTMRYAHLAPSVHRDAVQVLDTLVRSNKKSDRASIETENSGHILGTRAHDRAGASDG